MSSKNNIGLQTKGPKRVSKHMNDEVEQTEGPNPLKLFNLLP